MKKTITLAMVGCIFWLSPAVAKESKEDISKALDKAFDKVSSAYFDKGFDTGAKCMGELIMKVKDLGENHGIVTTEDEILEQLEQCRNAAKKEYDLKR